ncbi:hypothetical protein A8L34_27705 [Bacillus sp. FJAT-27264]|uniref:hypothetical protein n=1 Tax=Paenibacillus sp. (strain DSM 101736 / FJAT-27264) TaxID=1850362 RepID=UPI000807F458|nr:hypothetical protein [Bacillus sp. FJAT-27264]OBZ15837.1 hypothetical protein A8L34_27705 [Bacillus sp. FJAT-27264]
MRKRQIKKNEKQHVKIYPDEANLLLMTPEESQAAKQGYIETRKMLAKRRYKELKNLKGFYTYPVGKKSQQFIEEMARRARKS